MYGLRVQFDCILKNKNREILYKKSGWRGKYKRSSGGWGIVSWRDGFGKLHGFIVWPLERERILFTNNRLWLLIYTVVIWFK